MERACPRSIWDMEDEWFKTYEQYKKAYVIRQLKDSLLMPAHSKKQTGNGTTKCLSCGSREFRGHANRRICSYCRSER